jgi:hypothetical protein
MLTRNERFAFQGLAVIGFFVGCAHVRATPGVAFADGCALIEFLPEKQNLATSRYLRYTDATLLACL